MKKKIIMLALCVFMISGCGKVPKLSNGDEAVATIKGDLSISANEYYEVLKAKDIELNSLLLMADKRILEEEFSDKVEEAKEAAENIVSMYEEQFGERFEAALKNDGFKDRQELVDYFTVSNLRQEAVTEYAKSIVAKEKKQIEKYYDDKIVGDIKLSQILIIPKVNSSMTDEQVKAAEAEAKAKAEAIIAELNKTDKDEVAAKFAELASAQSDDAATKNNGGSFGYINKDTLSSDYSELVSEAYKLKDGAYSTKVITTSLGYHVILRTESKEKASLDTVKDKIIEKLAEEYLQTNSVAQIKALTELRDKYDFKIQDTELKKAYETLVNELIRSYTDADSAAQQNQ